MKNMQQNDADRFLLFIFVFLCLILSEGCQRSQTPEKNQSDSSILEEPEKESDISKNRPEKIPGLTAEKLLQQMQSAYANAKIYSDHAYIEAVYEINNNGKKELLPQRWQCSVLFKKPNFVRLDINNGVLVSNGETIQAKINDPLYENQYLEYPAPLILSSIKELYPDIKLANAMDLGIPATVMWAPPQLVLLLARNSLKTFVPGTNVDPSSSVNNTDFPSKKRPILLDPDYIEFEDNQTKEKILIACDRIKIEADDGNRILWINRENQALVRFELPLEQLVVPENIERVVSLCMEFPNQNLSEDPAAFSIAKDFFSLDEITNSEKVDHFLPPELFMLGKEIPNISIRSLVSGFSDLNLDALQGKNHLLCFWGGKDTELYSDIWGKSRSFLFETQQIADRFATDHQIDFLAVNFDTPQCSDNMVRNFYSQGNLSIPLYRLDFNEAQKTFLTGIAVPSIMIVNDKGIIQKYYQTPIPFAQLFRLIQYLLNDNSLYLDDFRVFDANTKLFQESMNAADANDIYYIVPETIAEDKIDVLPQKLPETFLLNEIWSSSDFRGFNNPTTVSIGQSEINSLLTLNSNDKSPSSESNSSQNSTENKLQNQTTDFVLVPCEGNAIAVFDQTGKLVKKVVPQAADEPITFIRTGLGSDGQRYFAASSLLESRKVHRFDSQLNDLGSLDVGRLKNQWVADIRFADINQDQQPELLIALVGDSSNNNIIPIHGIYAVDLKTQKVLWRDEMILTPYQIGIQTKNQSSLSKSIVNEKNPPQNGSDEISIVSASNSNEKTAPLDQNLKEKSGDSDPQKPILEIDETQSSGILWAMNHPEGLTGNIIGDQLENGTRIAEITNSNNESVLWLAVEDLDADGESEIVAFLAKIDPPELSFVSLKTDGTVLWRLNLPQDYQGRQMERISSGDINGDGIKEWILPTSDGAIRFINASGQLIDEFHTEMELTGVCVAFWNNRPHLILSDINRIVAFEIKNK
ncbi:MAG: hypothetical protein Q4C95_04445 [Planctomycetia bacterium]|nr:hypothetical protein [Planctomycetia bacterium]